MARARRIRSLVHPVTVTLDGEPIQAERGEPLVAALLAAGNLTLARSAKFHRPRGPSCLRGACDGCLARVDETPNTMTCMTAAAEGMAVVSQNRLGSRERDLLRMTDWFFPDGMNHHELFAGVPGIQTIMQNFARRVAGLGKLPAEAAAPRAAARRATDVVVVGAGPSGMAAAVHLASAGRTVEVLDDQLRPGGGIPALAPADAAAFDGTRRAFGKLVKAGKLRFRPQTTAGAVYGRDLLVAGPDGAEVVEARSVVLACGAHDGILPFEGNDLPGVLSARAAGWLLEQGILLGERIVVVVAPGGGPFGESFARAADELAKVAVVHGEPVSVTGSDEARGVRVRGAGKDRKIDADVVILDAPRSPAYELAEQAGARLVHDPGRGFVVQVERAPGGPPLPLAPGFWGVGEMTGLPFDAAALEAQAREVAEAILAERP